MRPAVPDEIKTGGLAPPDAVIDTALAVAGEVEAERKRALEADAAAMRALRTSLNTLSGKRKIQMTRPNLIALLNALTDGLRPATSEFRFALETGEHYFLDHPCVELLVELTDALGDLGRGKTDPLLRADAGSQSAVLTTKSLKQEAAVYVGVIGAQKKKMAREKRKVSRAEIESIIAQNMSDKGILLKGKPATARAIKAICVKFENRFAGKAKKRTK